MMTSRDGIQVARETITRPGRPARNLPDRKRNNSSVEVDGMQYDLTNLLSGESLIAQDPVPVEPAPTPPPVKPRAKPKAKKKSSLSALNIGHHRTKPKKALGLGGLSIGSRSLSSDSLDTDCQSLDTCEVFRRDKAKFDQEQQSLNNHDDSGDTNFNPSRRESPYRFNVGAMRTLMASFSDIPELQGSFRLSKDGQVLDVGDDSNHNKRQQPAGLLGGGDDSDDDYNSESEEEDLFGFSTNGNAKPKAKANKKKPPTYSSNSNNNLHTKPAAVASLKKPPPNYADAPPEFQDSALKDLVFDDETGTYVYRDEFYYEDEEATAATAASASPNNNNKNVTLEEMCQHAQDDDGAYYNDYDEAHEMEISPGCYVPFRGAKETWQAVATNSTVDLHCLDCNAHLVCINDCEYTVCPDCRVVNPIFCDEPLGKPYGVGMGFKKEWVLKKEMISKERKRRGSDAMSLQNMSQRFIGLESR